MPDKNNNMTPKEKAKTSRRVKTKEVNSSLTPTNTNAKPEIKKTLSNSKKRTVQKQETKTNVKYLKALLKLALAILLTLNVLAPFVIRAWPNIMSHMIFQTFIYVPFKNLSNPQAYSLDNTYPFRLQHDYVNLGAWHILPEKSQLIESQSMEQHFNLNLVKNPNEKTIIVLYLHGNTNDRSTVHRVRLYKLLRALNYHVFSMDYRGYGDSNGEPTEIDVVRDAMFTYEYIRKIAPWATIYIWGHSLGTGIGSHLSRMLTEHNKAPVGLVLESPFYNIVEEVEFHPFVWVFYMNKFVFSAIEWALKTVELQFRSDIHLTKVSSKIMILHSEDDWVIPIHQAEKLYDKIKTAGVSQNVVFHRIPYSLMCGHNNIHLAPNISTLIKEFIV